MAVLPEPEFHPPRLSVWAGLQVAVEVAADAERMMGPTASVLAEPPDPLGQAFNPVFGFTVKDMQRDKRFRVRTPDVPMRRDGLPARSASTTDAVPALAGG